LCNSAVKSRRLSFSILLPPCLLLLLAFCLLFLFFSAPGTSEFAILSWTRPRSPSHNLTTTPSPAPFRQLARTSALSPYDIHPHLLQPNSFPSHRCLRRGRYNVAHLAPRLTPHSASVSNSSATVAHPVGHVPNATQSLGVFIHPQLQKKCAYPCHPVFPDFPHSLSSATCIPSTTALSKSSLSSPSLPHRVHAHIIFTTNYLVCQHSPIVPSSQSGNQALLSHYRSTTSLPYGSTNSISARIFYPFNLFHPFRPALLTLQIMSKSNQPTLHFPPTTSPVLLTRPYIFSCPHGLLTTLLPHPPRRNPLP
jgi:hypothetical protein